MPPRKHGTHKNERPRKDLRADDKEQEDVIVLPDSENEEEEETAIRFSRALRYRERTKRSQMQDMTEEEMLDLAMKLSKQEANTAAQRRQLEDDAMKKAIEESLLASPSQASDVSSDSTTCTTKLSSHPPTVKPDFGRKLSYPRKNVKTRANESGKDSSQDSQPLPQMPDLSQETLSQPSSPSTFFEDQDQNEDVLKADCLEDEPTQSDSPQSVRLQQCSAALGKEPQITSRVLKSPFSTQDSSFSATCPSMSEVAQQQSPPPHKSPIFDKSDPKKHIKLSDDKISCSTYTNNDSDKVGTSKEDDNEENFTDTSHEKIFQQSRDPRKRLPFYEKSKPSHHTSVPDAVDPEQEAVQPKQMRDDSSWGISLSAILERVPKSEEIPLTKNNKSLEEFTSHIVLHLSDENEEDEEERVVPISPVFHQEIGPNTNLPRLSPTQPCCSLSTVDITQDRSFTLGSSTQNSNSNHECVRRTLTPATTYPAKTKPQNVDVQDKPACDSRPIHSVDGRRDGHVSYYWGAPFCPRGQNPDDYTRVILSQMEVYEKSLKEAQHQLLPKAKWGLPLSPCRPERPFGRSMKLRVAPKLLEEDEDSEPERKWAKEKNIKGKTEEGRTESQGHLEEAENAQHESYVVVSSPETQEETVQPKCSSLLGHKETMGAVNHSRMPSDLSEDTQIELPDNPEDIQNETVDVESTVCPETQMSEDSTPELMVTSPTQPQSRTESELMEVDEEGTAEDMTMVLEQEQAEMKQTKQRGSDPSQTQRVECPMCSCLFPISKIEVHAAYCDGTTEGKQQQGDLSQVVVLQERGPRWDGSTPRPENFLSHLNKYLKQRGRRGTLGDRMPMYVSDDGAGPSDVTVKNHSGLKDPSVVAEGGGNRLSTASGHNRSSIKSITPVSETTECLVDLQQESSARAIQRQGRKRKFKR